MISVRTPFFLIIYVLSLTLSVLMTKPGWADSFKYNSPGILARDAGQGRNDRHVYFPDFLFPLEVGPNFSNQKAYANSQIYPKTNGPTPAQNFDYPWTDTYCEKRSWSMPFCPGSKGHQGVDVRPNSKVDKFYYAVAFDDGIVNIVTKNTTVGITRSNGDYCEYLHMDRQSIIDAGIKVGVKVTRGMRIGKVSNIMGGIPNTSIHVHFACKKSITGPYVPVFSSLVVAYRRVWGLDASLAEGNLAFDPAREIGTDGQTTSPATTEIPSDIPKTFQTKNYGALTPPVEPAQWPEYLIKWPGRRIDIEIRDKNGHVIPAFSTDEAGIGAWWYWMLVRAKFDRNGPVTFDLIAQKYSGASSPTAPEKKVYIDCYSGTAARPGVSAKYLGTWIDPGKALSLSDDNTRWNIAQTIFHCEAGRPMAFDRAIFLKGLAYGDSVIANGFVMPVGTGTGPAKPEPTTPIPEPAATGPDAPQQSAEFESGDMLLRLPLSSSKEQIEKFVGVLRNRPKADSMRDVRKASANAYLRVKKVRKFRADVRVVRARERCQSGEYFAELNCKYRY